MTWRRAAREALASFWLWFGVLVVGIVVWMLGSEPWRK